MFNTLKPSSGQWMVALYAQASNTFITVPHKRTKNDQAMLF